MGTGPHFNLAKEKRFSFSHQMSFLREGGRRVGAYSNTLLQFRNSGLSSFCLWCLLDLPFPG